VVSAANTRSVTVTATGLPAGAALEVVQGPVDYAGTAALNPDTAVIATRGPGGLTGGTATIGVDASASSFVRTQVRPSAGEVVALSNPVWLLRETPAAGIPAPRAR